MIDCPNSVVLGVGRKEKAIGFLGEEEMQTSVVQNQDAKAFSKKSLPRYQVVCDVLVGEIADGKFPPGTCLPREFDLCDRFKVSRYTVRRALEGLRDMGLITSRSGVGTIVMATHPRDEVIQTLNQFEDVLKYPEESERRALSQTEVVADDELSAHLLAPVGSRWTCFEALRSARNSSLPFNWLQAHIREDMASILNVPNPAEASLISQIEMVHGVKASAAQVDITVAQVGSQRAELLNTESWTPALNIVRRYRDSAGDVYLVTNSIHPQHRFSMSFSIDADTRK